MTGKNQNLFVDDVIRWVIFILGCRWVGAVCLAGHGTGARSSFAIRVSHQCSHRRRQQLFDAECPCETWHLIVSFDLSAVSDWSKELYCADRDRWPTRQRDARCCVQRLQPATHSPCQPPSNCSSSNRSNNRRRSSFASTVDYLQTIGWRVARTPCRLPDAGQANGPHGANQ